MDFRQELSLIFEDDHGETSDARLVKYSEWLYKYRNSLPTLYRYTPANYNSIRGLEKGTLYLSEIGKMNDVFEGFSGTIIERARKNIDKISDMAYLKSFSENSSDLLMWGTYAKNYTGMCVHYNLSQMSKDMFYHLFPVCYFENRFSENESISNAIGSFIGYKTTDDLSEGHMLIDTTSAYLIKSNAWKHENEWRIIVPYIYMNEMYSKGQKVFDEDVCPEQYSISSQTIAFPYVQAVTLGPRIASDKKEHIIEICRNQELTVYETRLASREFALEKRCIFGNQHSEWHY